MKAALLIGCIVITAAILVAQLPMGGVTSAPVSITFAELQHPHNFSCASSTTCSITLTTGITAGSLLIIQAMASNQVYPVSINVGGTLIPVYSSSAYSSANTKNMMQAYVCSATSTAGPVVITFNGTTGGARAELREFSVTGGCNGNAVLDSASGGVAAGGTTFNGQTQTVNGTNDVLAQFVNSKDTTVSSVASPWNTAADFDATNGDGYARKINTTTGTAPSWTGDISSSFDATSAIAIGAGTTACNDEVLVDYSGGTDTNNLTTATMNSSTFGAPGLWDTASGTPATAEKFDSASSHGLSSAYRACSTGKTGSTTLGMKFDVSAATSYYFPFHLFSAAGKNPKSCVSVGFPLYIHIPTFDTGFYSMNLTQDLNGIDFISTMIGGASGGDIWPETAQDTSGASLSCTGSCNARNRFSYTQDTWYWVTYQMNKYVNSSTRHHMAIYDDSGTQLVAWDALPKSTTPTNPDRFQLGRNGDSGTPASDYIRTGVVRINYACTYPLTR